MILNSIACRSCLAVALAASVMLAGCADRVPFEYEAEQTVEYHYSQPGPASVGLRLLADRRSGGRYLLYVPEEGAEPAPLLIWQNGTGEDIETYDAIARHLASWGIAVLGSYDTQMGSGADAIAGLQMLRRRSLRPGSPLHGQVDLTRVGMAGSSQGAVGTVNAATRFAAGRRLAALAIHGAPTDQAIGFFGLDLDYETGRIATPVFVMTGTEDDFISPVAFNRQIFDSARRAPLRVLGVAKDADHIELAGDAGRMRGYLTAWFAFRLMNDSQAARAFVGTAEITTNPNWTLALVEGSQ